MHAGKRTEAVDKQRERAGVHSLVFEAALALRSSNGRSYCDA
jgi:hypothetical protein